jgi:uncharacterized protein YigE (DUF2233 family)
LTLVLAACNSQEKQVAQKRHAESYDDYTVYRVDLRKQKLRFFWANERNQPIRTIGGLRDWLATKKQELVFATNAGMYDENHRPIGYYVQDGVRKVGINRYECSGNFCLKPNGIFGLKKDTSAFVVETDQYKLTSADLIGATQSGPMLVVDGKIHPRFNPKSDNLNIRSGVGIVNSREVVFAISDNLVSFYEFATFFRDQLHCQNALFLDGTISRMFIAENSRYALDGDFGPMIAVVK